MMSLCSIQHRIARAICLALILLGVSSVAALAHPLGNFTTNRYSRLGLARQAVSLFYVVDMAEIPAFKAIAAIDVDKDGETDEAEQAHYLQEQMAFLADNLHLTLDGRLLSLQIQHGSLAFPPGQGGLRTVRLEMELVADLPAGAGGRLAYRDENYAGALGWREVIVQAGEGVEILASSAPAEDRSQALRSYPENLLQNPPALRSATVHFRPVATGGGQHITQESVGAASFPVLTAAVPGPQDPFANLIAIPLPGPAALVLALLAAFVWGAAHALSPGHGKTVVAAYLVGSRGTVRHALFLGLTTTLTHTAGVFLLGFITLFASRFLLPQQLFPWLSVVSGLLVVGIGLSLAWGRVRPALARQMHESHSGHDHDHPHAHDHTHNHVHHPPGLVHSHGRHVHSHLPPGTDGMPITWRSLLALGVSGGLLPCPSALVVMLGAVALDRIGFGLLLIVVFSLGLASVLTLIGVLMVHAGRLIEYVPEGGRLLRLAPIGSALFITLAGVGITLQALLQIGSPSL